MLFVVKKICVVKISNIFARFMSFYVLKMSTNVLRIVLKKNSRVKFKIHIIINVRQQSNFGKLPRERHGKVINVYMYILKSGRKYTYLPN